MHTRTFWRDKRKTQRHHSRLSFTQGKQILRLAALAQGKQILRLRTLTPTRENRACRGPRGSDARKAAQIKTGAYSPPRFSAPALKALPQPEEPGRSSTFGQLVYGTHTCLWSTEDDARNP